MGKQHVSFGCVGRYVGGCVSKSGKSAKHRASPEVRAIAKVHGVSNAVAKVMLFEERCKRFAKTEEVLLSEGLQLLGALRAKQQRNADKPVVNDDAARKERVATYLKSIRG